MNFFIIFLSAFILSLVAVYAIKRIALRLKIGSLPSPRKLHRGFKPLLGGVGFAIAILLSILIGQLIGLLPREVWIQYKYFWTGFFIVLLTGIVDDVGGISSRIKFLGEATGAILLILGGCKIQSFSGSIGEVLNLGIFSIPFTFLWIIFIINAINLLDGLDGLAAGVGFLITTGMIIIGIMINGIFLVVLGLGLAGALLGFLKYNYHPASIFMGEAGSLQLGYLLAFFSIENLKVAGSHQIYFMVALVLFCVPMTDTLVSFLRRLGQGHSPFLADKEHIHHRLLKLGLSHLQTVWLMYFLTFFYVTAGVLIFYFKGFLGLILFGIAFFLAVFWIYRLGYVETRFSWQKFAHQFQQMVIVKARAPLHFNRIWHRLILIISDVLTVNFALYSMHWFKFESGVFAQSTYRPISDYFFSPVFLFLLLAWIFLFFVNNLYQLDWDISRFEKTWRVSKVITFGIILLGLLTIDFRRLISESQLISLLGYWIMMIIFVNTGRLIIIGIEKRLRIFEYSPRKTLIIGLTDLAKKVYRDIQYNPHLIFDVIGFVAKKSKENTYLGLPVLGSYRDLPEIIHRYKIQEVIIALPESSSQDFINILGLCEPQGVKIKTLPGRQEFLSSQRLNLVSHSFIQLFTESMVLWQWVIKRLVDLLLSLIFVILLSPFLLAVSIILVYYFRKSVLVKVPVMGENGIPFNMYVFRLTGKNYDYQDNAIYLGTDPPAADAAGFILFLFRYRFYKLPQLLNVFLGDMSIVGPRPEPIEWYQEFSPLVKFLHRRIMVRPGLTGLAQVKYHYELSQKKLQEWARFDMYYTENLSLRMDMGILIRTILMIFVKPYQNSKKEKVRIPGL